LGAFEIEHLSLLDVSLCRLLISPLILPSCSAVAAFAPATNPQRPVTELAAERREFFSQAAAFAGLAAFAPAANAIRDYESVGLLGGSNSVDLNNANVRVYLKMPGLYPTIAGKIVSNGPYKTVSDIYGIPGLTGPEKEMLKKYESRFQAKEPQADYVIDIFNNGLYR
jgi:photosystem II PsbU protein